MTGFAFAYAVMRVCGGQPRKNPGAPVCYVSPDQQRAVLFAYDLHPRYREPMKRLKLQGLAPDRHYTLTEVNLKPGKTSSLRCNGKTYSGDYLMKVGIDVFGYKDGVSHVVELKM